MSNRKDNIGGHLGVVTGMFLIVSVILGSGILVLPGLVYEKIGRDGIYAWIGCAALCTPILLTMIILAGTHPIAGGVAYYAKLAFGQYAELFVSLLFLGATVLGLPSIAIVGATYLEKTSHLGVDIHVFAALLILLAAAFARSSGGTLRNAVNLVGGGSLFILLAMLLAFLVLEIWDKDVRFDPPSSFSAIVSQFPLIFFSFTGWDIACHLSEDFREPKVNFGRAMFFAFIVVCGVYVASAAIVQLADIRANYNTPMYEVGIHVLPSAPIWLVPLIGVSLIAANLFGSVVAVSRLVAYLSRRNFLPPNLNIAPRNSVYAVTAALLLVLACDRIGVLNIEVMFSLAGMNFLAIYMISALALVRLLPTRSSSLLATLIIVPSLTIMMSVLSSLLYIGIIALLAYWLDQDSGRGWYE